MTPMPLIKWIDVPPVWLLGAIVFAWVCRGPTTGALMGVGAVLVAVGLALMGLAIFTMMQARTTPVPHQTPASIVTSGVFAVTRNPIYLGDALVLTGLILRWGAWMALPLVPLFVWWITVHFIRWEEARLRETFPEAFESYAQKTRRWL